ncbi:hypothetical protein CG851_003443, partial [Escherichia coli]
SIHHGRNCDGGSTGFVFNLSLVVTMGKITFVVEFEDGKEPPVSANLDVAGGRLVSVLFGDYRDDFFQPEEVDVVREALNELSVDNDDTHAEIIQKMELLTH